MCLLSESNENERTESTHGRSTSSEPWLLCSAGLFVIILRQSTYAEFVHLVFGICTVQDSLGCGPMEVFV